MFIGRQREIKELRKLRKTQNPNISVIYGRRRVGKTSLIREAFQGENILFFEGLEGQPKSRQIANFLFQLKQQTNEISINYDVKDWMEALIQIKPLLEKQKYIIVLDEFQWMASYKDELVSELKMLWDQYFSKYNHTTLILCGSIASFMIKKVVRSKALYGRVDLEINLPPFKLNEARQMLYSHSHLEVLEAMLLVEGIPLYLKMLQDFPSIYIGVNDLGFRPNGYFTTEFNKIFVSHFGKKDHYPKIIRALSENDYGLFREDISKICKIPLSGHLSQGLFDLESAGFIKSFTPFDKESNSKIKKYILSDPYMNLYLKFIEPNLKKISRLISLDQEKGDIFLKLTQTSKFYSFLGKSFELFCQNHSYEISSLLGFSGIEYSVGPYFRKGCVQIDLLFDRKDNVITLCEMKYTNSPPGVEVIQEVEQKVRALEKISKKAIQKVLIVKDKVTQELLKRGYFYKIISSSEF